MVYKYNCKKYSFDLIEGGKEYSVPQIALYDANKSFIEFWAGLDLEDKEVFLVDKNPKKLKKMLDAADEATKNQNKKINELLNQSPLTLADLDKAYKAATEPGEPITPSNAPLVYYPHPTKAAYIVEEDNKEYIVTYDCLEINKMSLEEFWGKATQEVKNKMLSTKQTSKVNSLMEALKKALPPEPKPKVQFASLQEMYDSAQPVKLKKGAAKTVGTSAKKLTFGGGYPTGNPSYQPIIFSNAATIKVYEELLKPVESTWTIGLKPIEPNSPSKPEQQPKEDK